MTKIFADSEEKLVKNAVLYANSSSVLFEDAAKTIGATAAVVENAFMKGLIVKTASGMVIPTAFSVSEGVATVTAGSDSYTSYTAA